MPPVCCLFQSTLPCGSDSNPLHRLSCRCNFNPRSLAGATYGARQSLRRYRDFNPRSLAGATSSAVLTKRIVLISIHAPLRERPIATFNVLGQRKISIHAPLRERPSASFSASTIALFQSTLPCGSDALWHHWSIHSAYFNPRSLAGATLILR